MPRRPNDEISTCLQKSLSAPSSFASMSQPISESLAILSASVVPALEDTSNVAAKVLIASSEYVAASHRLDAVLNDAAQIRKNVLPRLRFCQTNDRWAPIWWNLLLLSMPRKHLQPQRLHFRFLKFAMAHRTGLALFLLPFRPFSIDETTRRALLPKRGPCSRPLASSGTRSASSMLAESPAWSFVLTVALVENFQMPSAIFIQSPVVCCSVGRTGSNGFWFDCISRYCVIQWVEEHGSCIVKGHNLPYWLMTPDVKRILVSQGVSAFARAICSMLRCHERLRCF